MEVVTCTVLVHLAPRRGAAGRTAEDRLLRLCVHEHVLQESDMVGKLWTGCNLFFMKRSGENVQKSSYAIVNALGVIYVCYFVFLNGIFVCINLAATHVGALPAR
jgi:hypothetical protein